MANGQNSNQAKRYPKFANFGEYLYWSYANLQMLCAALNMGKEKYDRSCYMIRRTDQKRHLLLPKYKNSIRPLQRTN